MAEFGERPESHPSLPRRRRRMVDGQHGFRNRAAVGSFRSMIAITITAAAYVAIKAMLLGTADASPRAPTGKSASGSTASSSTGFGRCAAPAKATAT